MSSAEYITLPEVREHLDLGEWKLRQRLRRAGVQLYSDPRNHRHRGVRTENVPRVTAPEPVPHERTRRNNLSPLIR